MLNTFNARVIFFALLTFAIFMALSPKPPELPIDQAGDKVQHVLAFAVLTVFARLGFPEAADRTILERMSFAGALIEVFQSIPMLHRDCDWRDWGADTLAVAGMLVLLRCLPWRSLCSSRAKR